MPDQLSLFPVANCQSLPIEHGQLDYYPSYIPEDEANHLLAVLRKKIAWEQSEIMLYGRKVKIPRLNAWYGDNKAHYQYSGYQLTLQPWLPELLQLKQTLEASLQQTFNSVLVNCYRDGQDSVAWHSDDEPELGPNPSIASISLGETRVFQFRLKEKKDKKKNNKENNQQKSVDRQKHQLDLTHGSLLVMSGAMQHFWEHQIPKTKKVLFERINLTYRYIPLYE